MFTFIKKTQFCFHLWLCIFFFILNTSDIFSIYNSSKTLVTESFTIYSSGALMIHSTDLLHNKKLEKNRYIVRTKDDFKLVLTLDPLTQNKMEQYLKRSRIIFGLYVNLDVKTGKILNLLGKYDKRKFFFDTPIYLRAAYPAASLFKIITAAAAMETNPISPDHKINIPYQCRYIRSKNWLRNQGRDKTSMALTDAFGRSCNVAFGRLALYWAGYDSIIRLASLFHFNLPIEFELGLEQSYAFFPTRDQITGKELAKLGAGFGNVFVSPIHAALLSQVIANKGVMMRPYIVDWIEGPDKSIVYRSRPKVISTPISSRTSEYLTTMMENTVNKGTSRGAFRSRRFPRLLVNAGGKTGTLTGRSPRGKHSWFTGFAPLDNPKIAISALVVYQNRYIIKGSHLARVGLTNYFNFFNKFNQKKVETDKLLVKNRFIYKP